MRYGFLGVFVILIWGVFLFTTVGGQQQQPLAIKALAERKASQLPDGPLFGRVKIYV